MDLYEAIEVVSELIQQAKDQPKRLIFITPDSEAVEAIEVCLEAAREQAGV